jgi:hypothetical protein
MLAFMAQPSPATPEGILLLRQLNIGQSGEDFFRQARRRVPLILAVSTGSANEA